MKANKELVEFTTYMIKQLQGEDIVIDKLGFTPTDVVDEYEVNYEVNGRPYTFTLCWGGEVEEDDPTPKEAFDKLMKEYPCNYDETNYLYQIVNDGLKEYEGIKEDIQRYNLTLADLNEACILLTQCRQSGFIKAIDELKAVKIIRENIDLVALLKPAISKGLLQISESDFELLKDVFEYIEF